MKIVFLYADKPEEWNCSHWRSYLPSTFLKRFSNIDTEMIPLSNISDPISIPVIENADIIFVERLMSNIIFSFLEKWRVKGKKVIFDMDDSYKNIPIGSGAYDYWVNGSMIKSSTNKIITMPYSPIEQLDWYTKLVDAISSPSKLILEDWKNFNEKLIWIPNFVDAELYQRIPKVKPDGKIVIGWGGGATHYLSWYDSGLITALRRIYPKYKKRIQILLITKDAPLAYKLAEFSPTIVRADRLTYPGEMLKLNLALAPVAGQYDRRRSWLKIAEYSACGIPWLASKLDPYNEYEFSGTRLVENKPAAWEEAISRAIEEYDQRFDEMQNSYQRFMDIFAIQNNHEFLANQFKKVLE